MNKELHEESLNMNNGYLEKRKKEGSKSSKFSSKSDDFALGIAKVAAAQVCDSVGFQGFHLSALETLSDIIVRYIFSIGKSANFSANLAGRVEANLFDIIHGLEELGSGLGFAGASDVDRCVVNFGIVRDIIHYVSDADFIPFAYDVPRFPVLKEKKEVGSFRKKGEDPPVEHIPSWLPAFPFPEAYATRSSVENKMIGILVGKKTESELAKVERKTERPLLNFQLRFANSEIEGGSLHGVGSAARAREYFEGNPYLAAPLHSGEKNVEVSPVVLPSKLLNEVTLRNPVPGNVIVGNHVSVLETFSSAIDAMKSGLCDSDSGKKKVISTQRPTLRFKIGLGKKSLRTIPDFNTQNENVEKDDKKRRVETILKESRSEL